MSFRLKIDTKSFLDDGSGKKCLSFAVVDLEKSESYPQNFVCILPIMVSADGKTQSNFYRIFRERSLIKAKSLLVAALKREGDPEVKAEIERRLKMLDPKQPAKVKCSTCGKLFQPLRVRKYKRHFCPECMKKKYT